MNGHRKNKILIVAYPNQGHINPSLRFANRLLNLGVNITFSTSLSVIRRIDTKTTHPNLTFAPFSDGHDDGQQPTTTLQQFISDVETKGACAVAEIITTAAAAGQPFDHMVYTTVLPWATKVASAHGLESTLLWCQPATVLDVYYYYFNGYESLISCNNNKPSFQINLPGLSTLTISDLQSFLTSSCPKEHEFVVQLMKDHVDEVKISPRILVNTFDELEIMPLKALGENKMFGVGPLVPLSNSFGCDLFDHNPEEDYMKWLNTKQKSSIVYISFGSLATLSVDQAEEIAGGLVESGRPFLWVMREGANLRNIEVIKKQGMIAGWCSQVEVLKHEAIGCFVTHCGWNSTMEALVSGVPTIGFPQWLDQATIAKMVQDDWKIGIKVKRREGDGVVEREEIKKCVEMVMRNEKMRRNSKKWRELATQAVTNDGSSIRNLQAFLDGA